MRIKWSKIRREYAHSFRIYHFSGEWLGITQIQHFVVRGFKDRELFSRHWPIFHPNGINLNNVVPAGWAKVITAIEPCGDSAIFGIDCYVTRATGVLKFRVPNVSTRGANSASDLTLFEPCRGVGIVIKPEVSRAIDVVGPDVVGFSVTVEVVSG
jgi:hypothetical protein